MKKKDAPKPPPEKPFGLCFRCEHRARFLETSRPNKGNGDRPRFECGLPEFSAHSCYMFRPVRPIVTGPEDSKDPRPRLAPPMFSARETAIGFPRCRLAGNYYGKKGVVLYWEVLDE